MSLSFFAWVTLSLYQFAALAQAGGCWWHRGGRAVLSGGHWQLWFQWGPCLWQLQECAPTALM